MIKKMTGGDIVSAILKNHGVQFLFTLCGGHISPILVSCKKDGITVINVRDEKNAVFAADASARLSGIPGVAAVTAGPGCTNTITAVKNAQMAQSPVIILGGATATMLKGRGSLQDIDQMALMKHHVKWAVSVKTVREISPVLNRAFKIAKDGVPGPVFVELSVDLLYDENLVRKWYNEMMGSGKSLGGKLLNLYAKRHLNNLFRNKDNSPFSSVDSNIPNHTSGDLNRTVNFIKCAERPVLVMGSQTMALPHEADSIKSAVKKLGLPTYLAGMVRGLLGRENKIQFRHKRGKALKEADLVIVCGFPFDFRLGYGRKINLNATVVTINRSRKELRKNRKPALAVHGDAGRFLQALADKSIGTDGKWSRWFEILTKNEVDRESEINRQAEAENEHINPLKLLQYMEKVMDEKSIIVADGGDFVSTASYILKPRSPLSWLDPGVFGTLGVGGGFAMSAKLHNPESEVWLIWGDGSAAFSLAEFDTFVRHKIPVIALVGTDASWAQIEREQTEIFGDDVGTTLRRTDYHIAAEGYGGKGFLLKKGDDIPAVLLQAKETAKSGIPVLINAQIGKTDFRKGSISM
tara:strand:- start:6181 stop:7920 length:1740 start_codon:yes stop_codon:yes gene_type:complete